MKYKVWWQSYTKSKFWNFYTSKGSNGPLQGVKATFKVGCLLRALKFQVLSSNKLNNSSPTKIVKQTDKSDIQQWSKFSNSIYQEKLCNKQHKIHRIRSKSKVEIFSICLSNKIVLKVNLSQTSWKLLKVLCSQVLVCR